MTTAGMYIYKKTPADSPTIESYTHPTEAHTLVATVAAQAAALRHSRFAKTTSLSRETAFAAAGPCLEHAMHAGGCLVSTRSCDATSRTRPPLLQRTSSRRCRLHCCRAAQASLGVTQSSARPLVGQRLGAAALPLLQHVGQQDGAQGSQGVRRNPRLAASGGWDRAAAATVAARPSPPSPLLRHGGGALPRE